VGVVLHGLWHGERIGGGGGKLCVWGRGEKTGGNGG
jgi:hypothetical protein